MREKRREEDRVYRSIESIRQKLEESATVETTKERKNGSVSSKDVNE